MEAVRSMTDVIANDDISYLAALVIDEEQPKQVPMPEKRHPSITDGNVSAIGIPLSMEEMENYVPFDGLKDGDTMISFDVEKSRKSKKDKVKKSKVKKVLTPEEIKAKEERKARKEAERQAAVQAEMEAEERKAALKEARRKERQRKEAENTLIKLISRKNYIKAKLSNLDPGKEKHSRMIAQFNIELNNIEEQINSIQTQTGIYLDKVEEGSRLKRFIGKVTTKCKSKARGIKKFFKKNKDLVVGLTSVILPVIGGCLLRLFVRG